MKLQSVETSHKRVSAAADVIGNVMVDGFHYLALFAIGGAIVWSAVVAFLGMGGKGHATIDDILLLFIYLELGAMVGIYFKTNHMPVRFLIYVAMTALTRLLILDVQTHDAPVTGIVWISRAPRPGDARQLVRLVRFPSRQGDGRD
jgi:phosphate starvation-inducible membrane PsiE